MDKKLNGWNDNKSPSSGIGGRPPYVERVAPKPQSEALPESESLTKEEIIKNHIPNGIVNVKGSGDGKPQYRAEIEAIERCMEEYKNQELAAASTVSEAGEDAIEVLKDIMLKFGNAHDMLAKSKLTKEEYQPISSLLAKGKIELFNFYQLYRKQSKQ